VFFSTLAILLVVIRRFSILTNTTRSVSASILRYRRGGWSTLVLGGLYCKLPAPGRSLPDLMCPSLQVGLCTVTTELILAIVVFSEGDCFASKSAPHKLPRNPFYALR
jgi:hypothetical protein